MKQGIGITGVAGLVGQNLIQCLKDLKYTDIVAIDKYPTDTAILRQLHPDIGIIEVDLAHDDGWQQAISDCDVVVCAHAQIGGLGRAAFEDNNVLATSRLLDVVKKTRERASSTLAHRWPNPPRLIGTPTANWRRNNSSLMRLFSTSCCDRP